MNTYYGCLARCFYFIVTVPLPILYGTAMSRDKPCSGLHRFLLFLCCMSAVGFSVVFILKFVDNLFLITFYFMCVCVCLFVCYAEEFL